MIDIIKEALIGSFNSIYSIATIVIPIMVILQILKDYQALEKITKPFGVLAKVFNISKDSVLPLLVGIIFGLAYGAGVIIQAARDSNLSKKDIFLVTTFLAACHAIFEDTLIFMAIGANGFILLGTRLGAAIILTFILSKRLSIKDTRELQQNYLK